jgi:acyl-CoA thioesterase
MTPAEDLYARDPTCRSLGIELDRVEAGCATVRMRVTDDMVNGHGIAHGGYLFLLADAAFAFASNMYGPVAVAQNANITFLRPAKAGDALIAEATERTRLGRNGVYDVTLRRADGQVVAEFRGHSVLVPSAAVTGPGNGGPNE